MKNKNIIRFVQSLVLLPFVSTIPIENVNKNIPIEMPLTVFTQKSNTESSNILAFNQAQIMEEKNKEEILSKKAELIDSYFKKYDMPLYGLGRKMVEEAEKNEIDWRLIPAISVRESTGGKFACKRVEYNAFGWASCKIGFKSYEHSIEVLAKNLGGNNPNTDHHYANKTTYQILQKYNPPSIIPKYAEQVIKIMDKIGDEKIEIITDNTIGYVYKQKTL